MAKWSCSACGYMHEGNMPPERCPICYTPASRFIKQAEEIKPTSEYVESSASISHSMLQGISVVSINVVSEQDVAIMVEQAVNKEIDKLNAQGKRVINVSVGTAVKNLIGMKHHIVILWESA